MPSNPYEDYIQSLFKENIDFGGVRNAARDLYNYDALREFEKLYGENIVTPVPPGGVQFSRPGSVMQAFQRRGSSVNDGPAMAAMSEGLRDYYDLLSRNTSRATLDAINSYLAYRGQNIGAAGTGLNFTLGQDRLSQELAMFEAAQAAAAEAAGRPISVPVPPGPNVGGNTIDDISKILGIGVGGLTLGAAGWQALKRLGWLGSENNFSQSDLDAAAREIVGRNPYTDFSASSWSGDPSAGYWV